MTQRIQIGALAIAPLLHELVADEIAPGSGVDAATFWSELASIAADFMPRNRQLLAFRDTLQEKLNEWHRQRSGSPIDVAEYRAFLSHIGYLQDAIDDFAIETENVDPEIASIAGPQLVVPLLNTRYALKATNARWGSLYDALYATDVIAKSEALDTDPCPSDASQKARVVAYAAQLLDEFFTLAAGRHQQSTGYRIAAGRLIIDREEGATALADAAQFVGYQGSAEAPHAVLLRHHGLHLELQIDKKHPIGQAHRAGIKDIVMEAAVSTIQDCEDSVAAVDTADIVAVYRNWFGLMNRSLTHTFVKQGETIQRAMNPDRHYRTPDGAPLTLPGCSLLLIRHAGMLLTTEAVLFNGEEIPEGILDAMVTALAALHDLKPGSGERVRNSKTGSVYIVKPKLHGAAEVRFTVALFARVEQALGMAGNTLKIGIMDEERRTTFNLKQCIHAAKERVIFINTGFLDRTGDEIHTSMEAGAIVPKNTMRQQPWISAYEDHNVAVGLSTGMSGKAQIGKGMWTIPDRMAQMLEDKIAHPRAGASTAWVPSPTAATLHAIHYHRVNVFARQQALKSRPGASLTDLLTIPLLGDEPLPAAVIQRELDNNCQSILGYVVHWVDSGIGCSKIPDINNVGLMEDRATLRISSQHICNWLRHQVVSKAQVLSTLKRMARIVDMQNRGNPNYRNMAPHFDTNLAFEAACELIFLGQKQPNGYPELILHRKRKQAKRQLAAAPRPEE